MSQVREEILQACTEDNCGCDSAIAKREKDKDNSGYGKKWDHNYGARGSKTARGLRDKSLLGPALDAQVRVCAFSCDSAAMSPLKKSQLQ